jgi:hypothetical protein
MDVSKELNDQHLFENENMIYLFLGIVVFLLGSFFSFFDSEKIFENIEKNLTEMKESIAFYTNKWLLSLNIEGNCIKTTQTTSF